LGYWPVVVTILAVDRILNDYDGDFLEMVIEVGCARLVPKNGNIRWDKVQPIPPPYVMYNYVPELVYF